METAGRCHSLILGLVLLLVSLACGASLLEWVERPQNKAIALGKDLVLSCQAKASAGAVAPENAVAVVDAIADEDVAVSKAVLSYTWLLEGGAVPARASVFSNHSLFLPSARTQDLGTYGCTVDLHVTFS
ncbi:uncharacterized protein LOC118477204, partial [Aplysia californica]